MNLAGFERVGIDDEPDATWIIPSALSAKELREIRRTILKHRDNPIMEYGDEDPIKAEDMLRRASVPKSRRAAYDDDSDTDGIDPNTEEFLFPAGGPTSRKSTALEELKHKRRKRNTADSEEGDAIDDETRKARRKAREAADLERRRKIKSNQFVRGSDEETDEDLDREFFAREEKTRQGQRGKVLDALKAASASTIVGEGKKRKKNAVDKDKGRAKRSKVDTTSVSHTDETENSDSDSDDSSSIISSTPRSRSVTSIERSRVDVSTPLSSPHLGITQHQQQQESSSEVLKPQVNDLNIKNIHRNPDTQEEHKHRDDDHDDHDDDDEDRIDEAQPPLPPPINPSTRARGRMLVLSDDSDDG
jgi:replication fork protection complex subunit Tof1/Swi1